LNTIKNSEMWLKKYHPSIQTRTSFDFFPFDSDDISLGLLDAILMGVAIVTTRRFPATLGIKTRDPVPGFSIWHYWIPGPGFWCYRDHWYYLLPLAINESDAMHIVIASLIDLLCTEYWPVILNVGQLVPWTTGTIYYAIFDIDGQLGPSSYVKVDN